MSAVRLQEKSEKLIAGHVAEKKGYLYCVLNVVQDGKRKPKWIPTHLKVKGNKTKAEAMLQELRREWTDKLQAERESAEQRAVKGKIQPDILFSDFLFLWLDHKYRQLLGKR